MLISRRNLVESIVQTKPSNRNSNYKCLKFKCLHSDLKNSVVKFNESRHASVNLCSTKKFHGIKHAKRKMISLVGPHSPAYAKNSDSSFSKYSYEGNRYYCNISHQMINLNFHIDYNKLFNKYIIIYWKIITLFSYN